MTPHSLALLLILLPATEDDVPACPVTFQCLKDTAHLLQLWDRDGHWGQYASEIGWCQAAVRRAWDAPPVEDANRLPSLDLIQERAAFAREHCDWLDTRQLACPWLDLTDWRRDAQQRWHWWERARYARQPGADLSCRRAALAELRETIGPAAYYAGDWPAWVPAERFGRVP